MTLPTYKQPKTTTGNPWINVVTVVLNTCPYLQQTIDSVARQSYPNIGHIIVDGGSTDGTLEIIKQNEQVLQQWISEPDAGISDAFNKGVGLCLDGYIIFLGAGDYFVNEKSVENVFEGLKEKYELVCGRIQRIADTPEEKVLRFSPPWPDSKFNKKSLLFKMSLPHQGLFMHTRFFEKHGLFDEFCRYAMDYDLLLRAYKELPDVKVVNEIVASWRAGGVGQDKTFEILKEYDLLKRKQKIAPNWVLQLINWYSIGKYYLRMVLNVRHS